ncbi:MAG: apolipoprotein N-acyltransferase [Alphaproteobacteria bacterium]
MTRDAADGEVVPRNDRLSRYGRWLEGRRAFLSVFCAGALTALAVPPVNLAPLWLVSLPVLFLALERSAKAGLKRSAALAWMFGFGHFGFALYWIVFSLFTDITKFWFLVPFVVLGLPAGLALFWAPVGMIWPWLARHAGPVSRIMVGAFALAVMELLRGHVLTGFPWGLAGYGWLGFLPLAQLASVLGVYGLTLMTFVIASLPAMYLLGQRKLALRSGAVVLALLIGAGIWGQSRIQGLKTLPDRDVSLRLAQPNIDQDRKWDRELFQTHMSNLVELSREGGSVDIVIWPESAVPFDPSSTVWFPRVMNDLPDGAWLLVGAVRKQGDAFFNSVQASDPDGVVTAIYDKAHLVPFGEYMPLRSVLPLDAIAAGDFDFTAGPGPRSLGFGGFPTVGPLVCYEAIFPGKVVSDGDRPDWLLTVTNDGWFGNSAGPHQHFAMARMRAIEEGLPMVRVANTGISGVVDTAGIIRTRTELGARAVVDSALPAMTEQPVFATRPVIMTFISYLIVLSIAVLCRNFAKRET